MTDDKNALKPKHLMDKNDLAFDSVFADLKINKTLVQQLKQVKIFYHRAFCNCQTKSAWSNVIKEYEGLIEQINRIKHGTLTVTQAIEELNCSTENKRIDIIIQNIFKACELLFWAASTAVFYVSCFSFGIPLMACEPVIGSLLTISCTAFLLNSLVCTLECFEQFKSFDSIDAEEIREKQLISFFNTFATNQKDELKVGGYDEEEFDNYTPSY